MFTFITKSATPPKNTKNKGSGGKGRYFSQFKVAGSPAGWYAGGGAAGCHGKVKIARSHGGGGIGGTCTKNELHAITNTGSGGGGAVCGVCDHVS